MVKRVAVWMGVLVLALIVGGGLGFGLAYFYENGWYEGWAQAATPPEPVARIRLINRSEVWVEAESGALYHNPLADTCAADCWFAVVELPAPVIDEEVREVFAELCVTPPPLSGSVERVSECQREQWVDYNAVYALQSDGTLRVWRYTSGGEWVALTYLLLIVVGAVGLFVVALVVLILQAVVRGLARRRAAVRNP